MAIIFVDDVIIENDNCQQSNEITRAFALELRDEEVRSREEAQSNMRGLTQKGVSAGSQSGADSVEHHYAQRSRLWKSRVDYCEKR